MPTLLLATIGTCGWKRRGAKRSRPAEGGGPRAPQAAAGAPPAALACNSLAMRWRRAGWAAALGVILASAPASAQDGREREVEAALERIQASVERFYARALHVLADVHVRVLPLGRDMSPQGRARNLLYEMRVEWSEATDGAAPEPVVARTLLSTDGRPPEPGDEPACGDPEPLSAEPLAVFLPARRQDYVFSWRGRANEAGRETVVLDYRMRDEEAPTIEWEDTCVSVDLAGKTRGRVWADAASGDVLRVDERMVGVFEFRVPPEHNRDGAPLTMTIERADNSVRYRPVAFSDPDETLLLPSTIELMTVWRNAGVERELIIHEISNYRRFLTGARVMSTPGRP